jgi:hypothetical protein
MSVSQLPRQSGVPHFSVTLGSDSEPTIHSSELEKWPTPEKYPDVADLNVLPMMK